MLLKSPELLNNCMSQIQFYKAARDALFTVLDFIDFDNSNGILLPAYIGVTDREGSGVFDPVRKVKIPYRFYTLDKSLSADKDELYSLIENGNYRALLLIHYFGFCRNDLFRIAELCRKNKVILIEDCAHCLFTIKNNEKLGNFGDFSIYSLHKFLATNDGGVLRINNSRYKDILTRPAVTNPSLDTLIIAARTDYDAIRRKRRVNYRKLLELLSCYSFLKIFYPELPDEVIPHNFPVIVKNGKREELYFKLIEAGIPVIALYYRMISPVITGNYENAHFLSENILNFPIHQDTDFSDLAYIADKVKEAMKT